MESLDDMRKSIDNAIVAMFAERFKITNRVGYYKAEHKLVLKDHEREAQQFERIAMLGQQYSLDPEFAKSYLSSVIERVVENHREISIKK